MMYTGIDRTGNAPIRNVHSERAAGARSRPTVVGHWRHDAPPQPEATRQDTNGWASLHRAVALDTKAAQTSAAGNPSRGSACLGNDSDAATVELEAQGRCPEFPPRRVSAGAQPDPPSISEHKRSLAVRQALKQTFAACALCALAACSPRDHSSGHEQGSAANASAAASTAEAASSVAPAATDVPAGTYTLDKAHASLLFRVNHLGFSHYTRRFRDFDAHLQFDPANPAASSVTASVDARSIETDYPDPALDFNAQLQGEQWLNTARYPQMTFRSTRVEPTGPNTMRIDGELGLRGVTRPMSLDATFNGGYAGHPMDPQARIGFSAHGTLKRSDYGMGFGIRTPANPMGVSDEVDVIIEAEFTGPAWAGAAAEPGAAHE